MESRSKRPALVVTFAAAALAASVLGCASRPPPAAPVTASATVDALPAGRAFGAIAFSRLTHSQSASSGWATREQAESEANRLCGARDCQVVTWVQHSCAALAGSSDSSRWGWGADRRRERAEESALATCNGGAKDCRVMRWVCTD